MSAVPGAAWVNRADSEITAMQVPPKPYPFRRAGENCDRIVLSLTKGRPDFIKWEEAVGGPVALIFPGRNWCGISLKFLWSWQPSA